MSDTIKSKNAVVKKMTQRVDKNSYADRIEELVKPLCVAENMELVHVEYVPGHGGITLRIFMDKPGGITIDDCVYMSRQIGDLIDVYMEDIGQYRLEVSSPGPKRPLKNDNDFLRFTGNRVSIETFELIDGRKKFTGILKSFSNDVAGLSINGKIVKIPRGRIKKARLA